MICYPSLGNSSPPQILPPPPPPPHQAKIHEEKYSKRLPKTQS